MKCDLYSSVKSKSFYHKHCIHLKRERTQMKKKFDEKCFYFIVLVLFLSFFGEKGIKMNEKRKVIYQFTARNEFFLVYCCMYYMVSQCVYN